MEKFLLLFALLFCPMAHAELSTSGLYDANGNPIVLGQSSMNGSLPIAISSNQSQIPVSQSGAWTVTSSGTSSVTQGTSPWVSNISQFGGNNVVTGTGASGLGIPRFTIANDSNILATQSGAWTTGRTWALASGTDSVAAVQSGAWTVTANAGTNLNTSALALSATQTNGNQKTQSVDASGNVQPAGDVLTRKIFVQPTDGSNNQAYTASNEAKVLVTPLTNSSVVKAQLQDNSGTAITLGQKTMSASVPVVIASDQTPVQTVGNVASAASDSGNPVKIGGVYNTATPTYSNGQRADLQSNLHGLPVTDSSLTDITGTFTSTANGSAIDASGYGSIAFTVNVSASSGTTPTLDVILQQSDDGSTNWTDEYYADRFTATGSYKTVRMSLHARYYRYRYVIGGSTPSFTFTVATTLKAATAETIHTYNKFNDLVMTTSNNFSSTVNLEGCSFFSATLTRGAGGAGVAVAAQNSNDGINWVTSGTSTNSAASTSYLVTNTAGSTTKYVRFTNTNNQAAATTMDIKYYCKE